MVSWFRFHSELHHDVKIYFKPWFLSNHGWWFTYFTNTYLCFLNCDLTWDPNCYTLCCMRHRHRVEFISLFWLCHKTVTIPNWLGRISFIFISHVVRPELHLTEPTDALALHRDSSLSLHTWHQISLSCGVWDYHSIPRTRLPPRTTVC